MVKVVLRRGVNGGCEVCMWIVVVKTIYKTSRGVSMAGIE